MAGRYRGPKERTPTADEFILARAQLVQALGDYMARVGALKPSPTEYLLALRELQRGLMDCTLAEFPVYQDKFKELIST